MNAHPYAFLLLFLSLAAAFPLVLLALAAAWRRFSRVARPGEVKLAPYECGVVSQGPARIQFRAPYLLYGILFLIFDVEVLFLLPLAVAFTALSPAAVLAVALFVLLLAEGLAWAWVRGHLEWR